MIVGVNAIIVSERGELLVIQRDDTRTWATPAGSIDPHEKIEAAMVREVFEETGFKVLPVRLVAIHFWPQRPHNHLNFSFRCLQRGGEAKTSAESLAIGFAPLPIQFPMLDVHKQRGEKLVTHAGGPVVFDTVTLALKDNLIHKWIVYVVYPIKNLRRRLAKNPYIPPPVTVVGVTVIVKDGAGDVLWLKKGAERMLPSGKNLGREAPWHSAQHIVKAASGLDIEITDLLAVFEKPQQKKIDLLFVGRIKSSVAKATENYAFIKAGEDIEYGQARDIARIKLFLQAPEETVFVEEIG